MSARRRDERGGVAVLTAVSVTLMMLFGALAVDLGNAWARRGQLQQQADSAAVNAAHKLPIRSEATRLVAAKAVARTIACQPVAGQTGVPACPASDSSPTLDAYAQQLLAAGRVSFPTPTKVKVVTPTARVDFGFGRLAGPDHTDQERQAIAQVGSPGEVAPMGLSLNCLLSAAGSLPAGVGDELADVMPLNYIAPGPLTFTNIQTDWPSATEQPVATSVTINPVLPSGTTQGVAVPALTVTGSGWGSLLNPLPEVRVWFALGKGASRRLESASATGIAINALTLVGTASVAVPPAVHGTAGPWKVKVAVRPQPTPLAPNPAWTWSRLDTGFTVELPTVTQDLLGCGRMLKSPRNQQDGTGQNLLLNLQEGIDHQLQTHPQILTTSLPSPLSLSSLLSTLGGPSGLFQCSNTTPHVDDVGGSLRNGQTPNCVVVHKGAEAYQEFTDGMLGVEHVVPENTYTGEPAHVGAGRLVCTATRPCGRSVPLTVGGTERTVNDDRFEDFIVPGREGGLTSASFFNLSTYLLPGVPVVTPDSAIEPEIYGSHRFMWVPVISSPYAPNDAGSYPIVTFRPIFITQDAPAGLGLGGVDLVLDLVDLWVKTALGITPATDHGIVLDDARTTLRAVRFMTVEPAALPAVGPDYDGPLSEYLGVGPRVVRLVR